MTKSNSTTSAHRRKRQATFWFQATTAFIAFSVFATPAQFHLDWYGRLTAGEPDWLAESLASAPLYFFALTLSVESNLRLWARMPNAMQTQFRVMLLYIILYAIAFLSGVQYFATPFYRSAEHDIPPLELCVQFLTGIAAFAASAFAHYVVTHQEARGIR